MTSADAADSAAGSRPAVPSSVPRYLQLLWGIEQSGRRGPKPSLTIQEIGAAACAIADDEGLAAVSMKRVAVSLGLTTMSLYRYLDSKEQLYDVMADCAAGPVTVRYGPRWSWRRRLHAWGTAVAGYRLAHPWTLEIRTGAPPATPNLLAWMEAGLQALEGSALTEQQRFSTLLVVDSFATGHARTSVSVGLAHRDVAAQNATGAAYLALLGQVLDPQRYPALTRGVPVAMGGEDEADFYGTELDFGLDLVLDGVAALIERVQRPATGSVRLPAGGIRPTRRR